MQNLRKLIFRQLIMSLSNAVSIKKIKYVLLLQCYLVIKEETILTAQVHLGHFPQYGHMELS